MVEQSHIEALFDCIDETAVVLYKTYQLSYLEGIVKACENVLSNTVEEKYFEAKEELELAISKVCEIEFNKEEIRKAFQYACLKGFKHGNISNQMITPETIGIFVGYLVNKLYVKQNISILDPLVGTGNLLAVVANSLGENVSIIGVDNDLISYQLTSALFDMLDYGDKVFYQDVNTFRINPVDLIVSDFSGIEEKAVYDIIHSLSSNISSGGFLIGIFDDEVISDEILVEKAKGLNDLWKLFGIIRLPNKLFKSSKKSIVIFQRYGKEYIQPEKFLIAELPDFDKVNEFTKVIQQLNNWFENIEFYKLGE